jgi:hypothetical protein
MEASLFRRRAPIAIGAVASVGLLWLFGHALAAIGGACKSEVFCCEVTGYAIVAAA